MTGSELRDDGDTYEGDDEERKVLLGALSSFYQYSRVAHWNTTHLRRQSFYALPRAHWELLAKPPFSYLDTLDTVDNAIDKNAEISHAILLAGLHSFGVPMPERDQIADKQSDWTTSASPNDLEKARSTLRQLFRDWSEEGRQEREACYEPIFKALRKEALVKVDQKLQVLVPGAGLGRLVFDLCCAGFDSEGNEISYHQLLASAYILNSCSKARMHTLYPWIHSFSNHQDRASHLRSVQIPDINPAQVLGEIQGGGEMSMSASDFLLLYDSEEQKNRFDAVAAVFFLDTAPNVIRYLEVIRNCLKPGGVLVNTGPLLWHFENNAPGNHGKEPPIGFETMGIADPGSFELTDDEMIALVQKMGFEIESRESGKSASYIQDTNSMLQNTYKISSWTARKK